MTRVTITTRTGEAHDIECVDGISLMENIRAHGLHDLLALCGGNCSCATCHVYIDEAWSDKLQPCGDDEDFLLDISAHRAPASRLSCQLVMSPQCDGLAATIAPELD